MKERKMNKVKLKVGKKAQPGGARNQWTKFNYMHKYNLQE